MNYEFIVVNGLTMTSAFHTVVATVLRWGGQN